MTEEPREEAVGEAALAAEPAGPADTVGSTPHGAPGGSGAGAGVASDAGAEHEREKPKIVIKDNRKVSQGATSAAGAPGVPGSGAADSAAGIAAAGPGPGAAESGAGVPGRGEPEAGTTTAGTTTASTTTAGPARTGSGPAEAESAQLDELRTGLEELTRDLQRVTAEYANYRKRVDRDRTLVADQAVGSVLAQLLPVLDDLDRARSHGDLVGPFAAVAEQLSAALGKFGLTAFGDPGDPFDPTLHEAVSHTSSPDVTETSCVEIMRRGYLLGDRLLRPALVAVADPQSPAEDKSEPGA